MMIFGATPQAMICTRKWNYLKLERLHALKPINPCGFKYGFTLVPPLLHVACTQLIPHLLDPVPCFMTIAMLIEVLGADVNEEYKSTTALLEVAKHGNHVKVCHLLLLNGASTFVCDSSGWTPLHFAASNGSFDVIQLLISFEATVSAKDVNGRNPYEIALHSPSSTDLVRNFLKRAMDGMLTDEEKACPPVPGINKIPARRSSKPPPLYVAEETHEPNAPIPIQALVSELEVLQCMDNVTSNGMSVEQRLKEIEAYMETIQSKLSHNIDRVEIRSKLLSDVETLKKEHSLLMMASAISLQHMESVKQFESSENATRFHQTLVVKLEEIMIGIKAVAGGVVGLSETQQGALGVAGICVKLFGNVLSFVPLVGGALSGAAKGAGQAMEVLDRVQMRSIISRFSAIGTLEMLRNMCYHIAHFLTQRYFPQLSRLPTVIIAKGGSNPGEIMASFAVLTIFNCMLDNASISELGIEEFQRQLMNSVIFNAKESKGCIAKGIIGKLKRQFAKVTLMECPKMLLSRIFTHCGVVINGEKFISIHRDQCDVECYGFANGFIGEEKVRALIPFGHTDDERNSSYDGGQHENISHLVSMVEESHSNLKSKQELNEKQLSHTVELISQVAHNSQHEIEVLKQQVQDLQALVEKLVTQMSTLNT